MEHEVFVPVPVDRLREALADPARVARAVPGLQQDAGAEPVAGRLKVRVGSHSVTYRGSARVSARPDGSYAVEGDAVEARGTGAVKLTLTLRLRDTDGGSTVTFDGTASADGRVTELPPDAVASAAARLLDRFAENLGAAAEDPTAPDAPDTTDAPEGSDAQEGPEAKNVQEGPDAQEGPETPEGLEAKDAPDAPDAPEAHETPDAAPEPPSAFEAEAPPPVPPPGPPSGASEDFKEPAQPPAEAAHARRTMIGRSAEEVDHAPPRGRYAPVPAPQSFAPHQTLRWAAPAAALALASAIVVSRALRRRH
ncbi:SRPBCC domain-containing protein [Streptomyces sp. NPDC058678]|uniref:SRPBCC domain-containing protein n=1 Tax=Streptomyces sp. NPDC058678 TaxID=3346595 RepID=UPI003648325D